MFNTTGKGRIFNRTRFCKGDEGTAAVEFAVFAVPFICLIVGTMEIALLFAAGTLLQGGTDEAGRLIRTGQVQAASDPRAAFEALLCDKVDAMIPCEDIRYEVIRIEDSSGFDAIAADTSLVQPAFDPDGNLIATQFDPGEENSLILVRAAYRYPLMTPFVAPFVGEGESNRVLLMSTTIIQNEPYEF